MFGTGRPYRPHNIYDAKCYKAGPSTRAPLRKMTPPHLALHMYAYKKDVDILFCSHQPLIVNCTTINNLGTIDCKPRFVKCFPGDSKSQTYPVRYRTDQTVG